MRPRWKPLYNATPRDIRIRNRGYLPHWELHGATYSITFRLHDSLPANVLEGLRQELASSMLALEAAGVTAIDRAELLRQHVLRVDSHLDRGYGSCILRDPGAARIVRDAILFFEGDRYELSAWCVMPNHVHMVMTPFDGWPLSKLMHSLKSFTSKEINKLLGTRGQNWQEEYYDRIIRDGRDLEGAISYVASNPAKAGLRGWEWVWP